VTAALVRRAIRDARVRTLGFAYLFAAVAYVQPVAYRHAYPTLASRLAFARSFGHNKAVVLFYGKARDLLTVEGYSAWRVGGTLAIFAAVFGLFAAVRALRTEEDAGRAELVLAGMVGRRARYLSSLAAVAAGAAVLWLAVFAGSLLGRLPAGGSAYLALAVVSVVPVFAGVGALASQLAPSRRLALELGGAAVALSLLLRVIADTSSGAGWLRWVTPLGWAEELRPFTGAQPLVLLLPLAAAALLLLAAGRIELRRDIGSGLLPVRDTAAPRSALLSSPAAHALREQWVTLAVWVGSVGVFALIIGLVSKSVSSAGISKALRDQLARLGTGSVVTPPGYIAFSFVFFVLALSLFACAQVAAARHEESEERLETLLAQPVGRRAWLAGRLALAALAAAAIALAAGAATWAGGTAAGVSLSLPKLLGAGANCLPATVLFLGVAALAYGLLPRASAAIAYGTVTVAFLWYLFGSLLGVPHWLVQATPFAHVGAVPVQSFRAGAAAIMVAVGLAAAAAATAAFERRDVLGS
jgi:ABC-2 type transport system permease protein